MTLKTRTEYTLADFKRGDQVRHVRQQTVYTVRRIGRRKVICTWNYYAPNTVFRFRPHLLEPVVPRPR